MPIIRQVITVTHRRNIQRDSVMKYRAMKHVTAHDDKPSLTRDAFQLTLLSMTPRLLVTGTSSTI
jgi:hypothetical protein